MKIFLIYTFVINILQKDKEQRYSDSYILGRFKQLTEKERILPSQKFHCTKQAKTFISYLTTFLLNSKSVK
jgi:hypothetical protein